MMKTDKKSQNRAGQNTLRDPLRDRTNFRPPLSKPRNLKVKKKKSPFPHHKNKVLSSLTNSKNSQFKSQFSETENIFAMNPDAQDAFQELEDQKMSLTSESNFLGGSAPGDNFGQINSLPVFKLLRAFKLQQYAKILAELGYGTEIYKLLLMSETQKKNLLSRINLMPGHRAKFTDFFSSIHQAYSQEESKNSQNRAQKGLNSETSKSPNRGPYSTTVKQLRKRNNLARKYRGLDAASKKNLNEKFLLKVLERPPMKCKKSGDAIQNTENTQNFNKTNMFTPNDPASMYEKYGLSHSSKFVNTKMQRRKERRRGTSHQNRANLRTLSNDPNTGCYRNETPNTLYEIKNPHHPKVPKRRNSKARLQNKNRLFKRSDVTLRGNPVLENIGLMSASALPVKPLKKFMNPLTDDKLLAKLPQSVSTRHDKASNSRLRKSNARRNLSEDRGKRKIRNYSEERVKTKATDFCITNARKFNNYANRSKSGHDQNSRDCASSTNATRAGTCVNRPYGERRKKRAYSGNNRRAPLDTGNQIKLPKINKESTRKTNSFRKTHNKGHMDDISSEIDKRNGISLSETQKESIKESNISEHKPLGVVSYSNSTSKENSYCSKVKDEYKLPKDEEDVYKIISKEVSINSKGADKKNKSKKKKETSQKGISMIKSKKPPKDSKNLKVRSKRQSIDTTNTQIPSGNSQVPKNNEAPKESQKSIKEKVLHNEKPVVPLSPLLTILEKQDIKKLGNSLDSKEVNDSIGVMEIDLLCKCLSHLILKHIEFSQGKVLVDDLVKEEQDIPLFTYGLGARLEINLEEIQREIQLREWEAQTKNEENFQRLQLMMSGDNPYMFHDQQELEQMQDPNLYYHSEEGGIDYERVNTNQIAVEEQNYDPSQGIPDLVDVNSILQTAQNDPNVIQNVDIQIDQRSNSQGCNLPIVQMGEMLQQPNGTPTGSRGGINSYYSNLSMMGNYKPFFFPPPDLGMVESMGSYENSSRFFRSVRSSNMNKSFNKNTSICGLRNRKNTTAEDIDHESPLKELPNCHEEEKGLEISAKKTLEKSEEPKENFSDVSLKSIDSNFSSNNRFPTVNSERVNEQEEIPRQDMACGPTEPQEDLSDENSLNLSNESYYMLEDLSREGLQKYLKTSMLVFNEKYSVKKKEIEEDIEATEPSFDLCYKYCIYVMTACKMEKEIPLIAILYLERLLLRTGILMNRDNWRRLILISMVISSKIWDDDSLENEHFPGVMEDTTIQEINTFERVFLDLIGYDLNVLGSEYAKYYFIFRTFALRNNLKFPLENVKIQDVIKHHSTERVTADLIREFNLKNTKLDQSI
ncbi:unnamed protein product [Moneuplotes crassus]|uniref:Cyclin N-terminal domain-containing protein n=1 Tax=Euplotes crassus TaxID=5936 RepID=A0AAD1UJM1_EUPCR|nr:unnamed protein product [Moneuplotes crassus]